MIITIVRSGTSDRTYINPSFASTAEMRGVKRDASTRNKIEQSGQKSKLEKLFMMK